LLHAKTLLQAHRSPPPQNETTDTGQVDRYQRQQAYDGTHIVRDDRAFTNRLLHRLTKKSLAAAGLRKSALTGRGPPCRSKNVQKLIPVPWRGPRFSPLCLRVPQRSRPPRTQTQAKFEPRGAAALQKSSVHARSKVAQSAIVCRFRPNLPRTARSRQSATVLVDDRQRPDVEGFGERGGPEALPGR
jgi:hypothetical protein